MEMAEFISMIRLEEAQADEDEYWRTHGWARLKRNVMMFVRATFERKADVAEEDMKMIQSLTAAMDEEMLLLRLRSLRDLLPWGWD